ncbi:patatin-like phospholipase family protein [Candidatus Woesearchaeota archaeon]|nr:patatin-like phospholipase family protein [Candidatus Woesearchaeota archaeon]
MGKKIGLLLSGGGIRGFAHIGVLKVLDKNNIKISAIGGTSIGAIVGALYASGYTGNQIEEIAVKLKKKDMLKLIDISLGREGLVKGDRLIQYLKGLIPVNEFSELKIPLVINATDLTNKKEVVFTQGSLFNAIRASISLPGVFTPYHEKDRTLVDGAITNPVCLGLLDGLDIGFYIVVNVATNFHYDPNSKLGIIKQMQYSMYMLQEEIIRLKLEPYKRRYVMIEPDVHRLRLLEFTNVKDVIEKGEKATIQNITLIRDKSKYFLERVFLR